MFSLGVDRKALKQYALIALAYLVVALVFFWPILPNLASSVPGAGGDIFQSMWELWWVPYSMFTLHSTPYFTSYVFYPVGASLATQTLAPLAGILSAPFQAVSLAFAYNILFLLGFALAGLFTYMLAFHVTKHRAASFVAGFIFAFSPIHTIQAFGHLQYTNIEFIPLFLLLFMLTIEHKRHTYAIGAAVAFVLLAFMGDIEQGLIALLMAFFVLVYMLAAKGHRQKVLDKRYLMMLGETVVVALVLASPFILGILSQLSPGALAAANAQATQQYNELYSPDLLSFLVPSAFNGLLSPLSSGFSALFAPAQAERTTYIGYSVILLALVGLLYEYKKDRFASTGVYLLGLVVFGMLSVGPYLQINGNVTPVPGLYLLYHQIPLFNVLREPGRFDIAFELFIAIFAAVGLVELEKKYSGQNIARYLPAIFMVLLVVEYNSWPVSQSALTNMYTLNATIPKAYYEIGALRSNFSVLVLPAIANYSGSQPELYPGMALYYQTAFKKPLVGGYTTRSNTTQAFSLINVPLIASAYYLESGQGLVYGSPIQENYTNATAFFMGAYNVGFIAVIRQAYSQTEQEGIASYLANYFGTPVYQSNDTLVFPTTNIVNISGTSLVAFSPTLLNNPNSIWQPGWLLCGTSPLCSHDYLNAWFGINPAYISIYSPNYTKVAVAMRALAPFSPGPEYVYLNNQLVTTLNLTNSFQNFTIDAGLSPGINYLVLASHSPSNQSAYSNIGVANVTVIRRS
ncbi:MAG: hypothetical protein KGI04_01560 [Candidatus Micrarchaeota archaeon]|nr:hypothetical protein [Candidatus Micrarchaeota archaeon]